MLSDSISSLVSFSSSFSFHSFRFYFRRLLSSGQPCAESYAVMTSLVFSKKYFSEVPGTIIYTLGVLAGVFTGVLGTVLFGVFTGVFIGVLIGVFFGVFTGVRKDSFSCYKNIRVSSIPVRSVYRYRVRRQKIG